MSESYITSQGDKGSINISEDVVISVVKNTIYEIDGVACIANANGTEIAEMLGISSKSNKGLKIQFEDGSIIVEIILHVKYDYNIIDVANKVQNKVAEGVRAITGIDDVKVNVHVSGIAFEK